MTKFAVKSLAVAASLVFAGSASAGVINAPATDVLATVYAVEALTATTDITLPTIQYTMGVARTLAQDFTVILTPSAGATFTAASCAAALPTKQAGTGAFTASVKRSSTSECAYEVDITTASDTTLILAFAGLVLDTHTLNTPGSTASVTLALKDLGETAFIDNSGVLTRRVASSVQAVNIYAATSDIATTVDVNAVGGPLTGFVAGGDDTIIRAAALLTFDNNSVGAKAADGATTFDFRATTGTAAITLTGTTSGVATDGLCIDLNADSVYCETGEKFGVTSTAGTISGVVSTVFPVVGNLSTKRVTFLANGTTQLGTSRTFAVTGTITPQVGAVEPLADTAGKNATYWVWTANASQLMTPYMSTNTQYVTRFSLLNTGSAAVGYSVRCYAEGAATATNGAAGTLKAAGTTVLNATDVCTFSGAPRGAVTFTINAPINSVKGVYNIVDAVTGANGFVPLTRPYNSANTTE